MAQKTRDHFSIRIDQIFADDVDSVRFRELRVLIFNNHREGKFGCAEHFLRVFRRAANIHRHDLKFLIVQLSVQSLERVFIREWRRANPNVNQRCAIAFEFAREIKRFAIEIIFWQHRRGAFRLDQLGLVIRRFHCFGIFRWRPSK